jgi:hypothetical protein
MGSDTINLYTPDGILVWCHKISQPEQHHILPLSRTYDIHKWTAEEIDFLDKHYGIDMNSREIAEELNIIDTYKIIQKYQSLLKAGVVKKRELPKGGNNARYDKMRRLV